MPATQQTQQSKHHSTELPTDITSPRGKLLYLFIKTHNGITVDKMRDHLNEKTINLYGTLKSLEENNHITRTDGVYY